MTTILGHACVDKCRPGLQGNWCHTKSYRGRLGKVWDWDYCRETPELAEAKFGALALTGSAEARKAALTQQQQLQRRLQLTPSEEEKIKLMRVEGWYIFNQLDRNNLFRVVDSHIVGEDGKKVALRPGDHIYLTKAFGIQGLSHHGVYIGKGYIVDVAGAVGGFGDIVGACRLIKAKPKGYIALSKLEDWAPPGVAIRKRTYTKRRPRRDSVAIAVDSIGTWEYGLFDSNCEHFATFITSGQWDSRQISNARDTVVQLAAIVHPRGFKAIPGVQYFLARLNKLRGFTQWFVQAPLDTEQHCVIRDDLAGCALPRHGRRRLRATMICDGKQRCINVRHMRDVLRAQKRKGQPPHDPDTGVLLTERQVAYIEKAARR